MVSVKSLQTKEWDSQFGSYMICTLDSVEGLRMMVLVKINGLSAMNQPNAASFMSFSFS